MRTHGIRTHHPDVKINTLRHFKRFNLSHADELTGTQMQMQAHAFSLTDVKLGSPVAYISFHFHPVPDTLSRINYIDKRKQLQNMKRWILIS